MQARAVEIIGGGPAGAAAALAAAAEGARTVLHEKSTSPRHKVCGEFLSPEVASALDGLGLWAEVEGLGPALIRLMRLRVGGREKRRSLPETAYGLSRYALDRFLLQEACRRGATVMTGPASRAQGATVVATGRSRVTAPEQRRAWRLFGFKAHFAGPPEDAVELFFFDGCYVGVSPVEKGATNVCGLGPAGVLGRYGFRFDEVVSSTPALRERLSGLSRTMDWVTTGPLVFGHRFRERPEENVYPAGDALGFVDPFTGSGILNALWTGRLAGLAASRGAPVRDYMRACEDGLGRVFRVARLIRGLLDTFLAEAMLPLAPGGWLFHLTRPALYRAGKTHVA